MGSSEILAATGSACLIKHGRSLPRGLAQVNAGNGEMLARMVDRVNFFRMREDAGLAVANDGAVFPAPFPKLVANLEIFLGEVIAIVVLGLGGLADVERAAVEIGS